MRRFLLHRVKALIPKLSNTELIVLRSGTVSMDRDIFKGRVDIHEYGAPQTFDHHEDDRVEHLLQKYKYEPTMADNNKFMSRSVIQDIADKGFFSYLIDSAYGGRKQAVTELSKILTTISSIHPALGVIAMVPNSLGPGELLTSYGTTAQKDNYLPKLASGELIPCFGLTGPQNGSDATGQIDQGELVSETKIKIHIDKRYITLAPVANLIGLAFDLKDPSKLLTAGNPGITVALVERTHPGLEMSTHHNPLDVGFPNGTVRGSIEITTDQIIGGPPGAGEGWKMLVECLAAGRGICLPATANATAKVAAFGIYHYGQHRTQFKMPLLDMQGVQEKFDDMLFHTWLIHASCRFTNHILDQGERPAVISAIMKQQTTERARIVLNHAMDIHAGNSICMGYSNFLEKFYKAAPIGITVEGSNTLTRSLIIFGQGLNKSHPHIFNVLEGVLQDSPALFWTHFRKLLGHTVSSYVMSVGNAVGTPTLDSQTRHFANISNFVAAQGGALKKNQVLSGKMADFLSNLYLAHSVAWNHLHYKESEVFTRVCIQKLVDENTTLIREIIGYLPWWQRTLLYPISKFTAPTMYAPDSLYRESRRNDTIMQAFKDDIFIRGTILEDWSKGNVDASLARELVSVGEYKTYEP